MNLDEIDCAIDNACDEFNGNDEIFVYAEEIIDAAKALRASVKLNQINTDINKEAEAKMKPFDLEAAKNGEAVVTRDGRKVRIICFDINSYEYPLATLITHESGEEDVNSHTSDGKYHSSSSGTCELDLFMAPTKKECWINFYGMGKMITHFPFPSKLEADAFDSKFGDDRISCIYHTWEE